MLYRHFKILRLKKYDNIYSSLVLQAMRERDSDHKNTMHSNKKRILLAWLGLPVILFNESMQCIHCTGPQQRVQTVMDKCRRDLPPEDPKDAYSAHVSEPGVAGTHMMYGFH